MRHVSTALINSRGFRLVSKVSLVNVINTFSGQICKGNLALKEFYRHLVGLLFFFLISLIAGHVNAFENPSQSLDSQRAFNSLSCTTKFLKQCWASQIYRHLNFGGIHYKCEPKYSGNLARWSERYLRSPTRSDTDQIQRYYERWFGVCHAALDVQVDLFV